MLICFQQTYNTILLHHYLVKKLLEFYTPNDSQTKLIKIYFSFCAVLKSNQFWYQIIGTFKNNKCLIRAEFSITSYSPERRGR